MSNPTNAQPTTPTRVQLAENEVAITVTGPLDDLGRAQFTAFWIGTDHLREGKVAAQVFHTNVADFVRRDEQQGRKVTGLDEATRALLEEIARKDGK